MSIHCSQDCFFDGRSLSKKEYRRLYEVIGESFGSGPGTFNLPDFRGRFLRGVSGSTSRDRDPDVDDRKAMKDGGNAIGSVQEDALEDHSHIFSAFRRDINNPEWGRITSGGNQGEAAFQARVRADKNSATFSSETRPKNAYVQWMIKVR